MSDETQYEVDQDVAPEPMPRPKPKRPIGNLAVAEPEAPPAEEEIDFKDTLEDTEVTSEEPEEEAEPQESALEILEPSYEPVTWTFGQEPDTVVFVQRKLSFIGRMQWFALVGGALDAAMSGPDGLSVNNILGAPEGVRGGQMTMADLADADTFVQAIAKLLAVAPDFLMDSYMIWLNVPTHSRPLIKQMFSRAEDEGGLTEDQGVGMVETFLDQNYDALADFFGGRVGQLSKRVQQLQKLRGGKKG